jgi:putative ABC transport system ATP-binding protein
MDDRNIGMDSMLIRTVGLSKSYHTDELETLAVKEVSLEIEKGEFVAVMGPSGCGKTSLLNLLGLIDSPTSGQYILDGKDLNDLTEQQSTLIRRGNLGFIFQNYNLVEELNVLENVELPLFFTGEKRKERREKSLELLDRLKLGHRVRHYPGKLSGGQQQRVAFARAIVNQPKLLLADEPTGNLDSKNGALMMDLLVEYNQSGGTIVMVSHSHKDASYAHRIIGMQDGTITN